MSPSWYHFQSSGCFRLTVLFVLLMAWGCRIHAAPKDETAITSPAELWAQFDPEAEPLEEQILASWTDSAGKFEKLYFTGETVNDFRVRVFAIVGLPIPKDEDASKHSVPGILHIHGGGQTASLDWVKFWCQRGYACATFDFCGEWQDRKEFTDWGPLRHCNMAHANGGMQVDPSPKASSWYHWAVVARRALTVLASRPKVDRQRLGIFGVSVGGSLCWNVAAFDHRVSAAVPIYGCGYNTDESRVFWGSEPLSPSSKLWQQTVSPEAHAPYIHCPLMLLNGTNDFHGWLDYSQAILKAVPNPTRAAFSPNMNHHIRAAEAASLVEWTNRTLRDSVPVPKSPNVTVDLDDNGVPRCRIGVDETLEVNRVEVYYALGLRAPPNRFWRKVVAERIGDQWIASMPVMSIWDEAHTFANVYYSPPLCLSSNVENFVPGQIGIATPTLRWHPKPTVSGLWRYQGAHTDPNTEREYLFSNPADFSELRVNAQLFGDQISVRATTNVVADPQFVGKSGMALAFEVLGVFPEGLTVTVTGNNGTPKSKTYRAQLPPMNVSKAAKDVLLPPEKFRTAEGEVLRGWQSIDTLQLEGIAKSSSSPLLRNFRWELTE